MATFQKRSGHWRATIRKAGVRTSATFVTKAAAVRWADDTENEATGIKQGSAPNKTLRQAFERYRDEVSVHKRGAKWECLRINAFCRDFSIADKRISKVNTPDLALWRDARLKTVSAGSVLREINLLSAVFNTALREWQWIEINPMKGLRRPSTPRARTRRISNDELARLCEALGYGSNSLSSQIAVALLLACETAMRQGEMLATRWEDVRRNTVHIPMSKTGLARDVPLSKKAIELVESLRGLDENTCFTVSSASADALFRKAKTYAGISGLTFHDSRREGTSRLAKKVDVLTLARITGHKNINMLLVYYQTDMTAVADSLD